ncbi:hypothetical protein MTR67_048785 [Solanum verrucosum]|uniref:Uncharacterized protein n=1 Tax=Solanum verrucosum TaxID=315347 RepID=A0AAF0ZZZ4_SOLVR|nr:hypothetical protein MTR67_048785 [Solanum verrucosum]
MHYNSNNFLLVFLKKEEKTTTQFICGEETSNGWLIHQGWKIECWSGTGWEKAKSEAATLKKSPGVLVLLKLTAEHRASHLDGALKEYMRQIRNLKEEHEQKLHDVI